MAFYIGVYAYAIIVHKRANQLLPQLLMEQFDVYTMNRHIEHIHEGVWFKKRNFDKTKAMRTQTIFPQYRFCICIDSAFMGRSTPTTAFDGAI